MNECDSTLLLMLNWCLVNRLIEDFHVGESGVIITLSDGLSRLSFEEARTFMNSVVLGYARSTDSTLHWPAEPSVDPAGHRHHAV